jgi:hypothetical protein
MKIKELSETLQQIFVGQQEYFKSVIALLKYIKTNYVKMIGYKKTSQALLANKCFDFDIQVFETLVSTTSTMYQTIEAYKAKHSKWFDIDFTTEFEQSGNTVNAANELEKYRTNPELMAIELRQFELYMLIITFHCFTNQADIWKIYLDLLPGFIKSIANETKAKMDTLQKELTSYNSFVSKLAPNQRKDDSDMLREFAKRILEDESNYNLYSISKKDNFLTKKNPVTEQEKRFIGIKEKEVEVYEWIMLFPNLLELRCLRQYNAYISEQNMFTLQIEIARTFKYYYQEIEAIILKPGPLFVIPKSIMWSTEELNETKNKTNPDYIASKINSSERTKRLYEHKTELIDDSIDVMETYCGAIHKMIDPILDTDGLTNVCHDLQQQPLISNLLNFPDYETRLWKWSSIPKGKINVELTDTFNSQIARVYKWYKIVDLSENTDAAYQDWVVLDDFPGNTYVDKLLKEFNGSTDKTALDRLKKVLSCELIIFEMKTENNANFNYETGVGMKGGWQFSKIEDIDADFGLDCQGIDTSDPNKKCLFLVKVTDEDPSLRADTTYKLVYNDNKNLIPDNNYLYSFKTISDNIQYVDAYIQYKCVPDSQIATDIKTKTDEFITKKDEEKAYVESNLAVVSQQIDGIEEEIEYLLEEQLQAPEQQNKTNLDNQMRQLEDDLINQLKEKKETEEAKAGLEKELEDVKDVQKDIKKEKGSKLIYNDLLDTDISTIDDIQQLNKMKTRVRANITRASNVISKLTEDIKLQQKAKSVTKKVTSELGKHRLYNENVEKKAVNDAKLAEIEQRVLELGGQGQGQVGGADSKESARDRYYLTQGIQGINSYGQPSAAFQQPYLQQPLSYGQQPIYPSLNPFQQQQPYSSLNPFQQQQMMNPLQQHTYAKQMSYLNKALELESKLAFYVNVELTLFPGTSANQLEKASALCSARFDDVRKALLEILNLEYRPRQLVDSSMYQTGKDKDKDKDNNKYKKRGGSVKNRKLKKNKSIKNKV